MPANNVNLRWWEALAKNLFSWKNFSDEFKQGLSYSYDRYGNRTAQSISSGCTGISCPTNTVAISPSNNNQLASPYAYDAGGNMTYDGTNTIAYDGEGRAVTATNGRGSGAYTYDGHGLRVKKVSGSTTTVYLFSGSKVVAEYVNGAAPSAPTREYIYAGGALLARIDSTGTKYYHQDHLSNRMVTNSTGGVAAEMGHFPYGESWYNASNDKLLFTTYERDAESGNDYAMARYHISRLGRLSSPDPIAGSTANPQSLNRYSYSINDPANVTDPSGAFTGCDTAEAQPKDKTQEGSGDGPSDASGDGADAAMQGGCQPNHHGPGGWSWAASLGLGGLDGGFAGDDSGGLPNGGFTPGGDTFGLAQLAFTPTSYILIGDTSASCLDEGVCGSGQIIPIYGNLGLLASLDVPTSPSSDNGNDLTPKQAKALFYKLYGQKLNDCIRSVFGADAANVPQQTLNNAPILNAMFSQQQLTNMAGQGAVGWNQPNLGTYGTVYEANDTIFHASGSNTRNAIFGTFAHELGNILDERMNPPGTTGGQPYGGTYGNPHEPNGDWDTGQQVEDCIFGGPQYPNQ